MMIANPETMRVESLVRTAAGGRKRWLAGTALAAGAGAAALGFGAPAAANPTDGRVVSGSAEIVTVSPAQLDIVQSSRKAIINWGDFSIQPQESTNFLQPGRNSWTLNRVTGGNPSQILGALTANGNVIVLNQNGVLFGPNSRIDVGGLIASTANIVDTDFLADQFRFEGAPQGTTVVNQGRITVAEGGLAALVAPGVGNSGVIEAKLGRVSLAAGTAFTVDLYGDGLVSLALGGEVTAGVTGPDGTQLAALVTNDGRITADGGRVLLTAEAAKGVVDSVINMGGVIEARTVGADATGAIVLGGGESGVVEVAGTLDASGVEAGAIGGTIEVTGELVRVQGGARLDASGAAGGGTVLVGGDFQGGGETPTAQQTLVEAGARLSADATQAGDGGRIIVWAEETTRFYGHLTATGGPSGGDGGFAEISGRGALGFSGIVDLSAVDGSGGTVLFDPRNTFIANMDPLLAETLFMDAVALGMTLAGGTSAVVTAANDITVDDVIDGTSMTVASGDLTLRAGRDILLNANIFTTGGDVTLLANDPAALNNGTAHARQAGDADITGGGSITTSCGPGMMAANGGNITLTIGAGAPAGALGVAATGGSIDVGDLDAAGFDAAAGSNANGGAGGTVTVTAPSGNIAVGTINTFGGVGDATGGGVNPRGFGGAGGAVTIAAANGTVTLNPVMAADAVNASGGNAAMGGGANGGAGGAIMVTAGMGTTLVGMPGDTRRLVTRGGAGDSVDFTAGGLGGNVTVDGVLRSVPLGLVAIMTDGGAAGVFGSGGNAGNVTLLDGADIMAGFLVSATGGASFVGGTGGRVDFDAAVIAESIAIDVDGGAGAFVGAAGTVTTADLATRGGGNVIISALGAVIGVGTGVISVADVTTTAMGFGSGNVTLLGAGDVSTLFVDARGFDAALGNGFAGGDVALSGANVTVDRVETTGGDGGGAAANGGAGGDIAVTATAAMGNIGFGTDVIASGGRTGLGAGGTGGKGGVIMLDAGTAGATGSILNLAGGDLTVTSAGGNSTTGTGGMGGTIDVGAGILSVSDGNLMVSAAGGNITGATVGTGGMGGTIILDAIRVTNGAGGGTATVTAGGGNGGATGTGGMGGTITVNGDAVFTGIATVNFFTRGGTGGMPAVRAEGGDQLFNGRLDGDGNLIVDAGDTNTGAMDAHTQIEEVVFENLVGFTTAFTNITITADFVELDQTRTPGLLDVNATVVRLEGDLMFGSINLPLAPTKVQVGSIGTGALGGGGSIQDAIDIAAVDARILLDAGAFNERGILLDKRVDIEGAGKDPVTGSIINASPAAIGGFIGRGDAGDGITVAASGVGPSNTLLLQDFAVTNAQRDGIALRVGGTISFIELATVAARMNGDDGITIVATGTVTDLVFNDVMSTMNGDDGLEIEGTNAVRRLAIGASMFSGNMGDGIGASNNLILSDIAIGTGTIINRNFGNGIHIAGGMIAPQTGVVGSFGLLIDQSQIVSNRMNGVLIETVATVRDLTIQGSVIANNGTAMGTLNGHGIFVRDSTLSDLVVDDSDIGTNGIVAGNDGDGIRASNATLSGVLIRNTTAIAGNAGSGVRVTGGTITTGAAIFTDAMMMTQTVMTGLKLDGSFIVANMMDGLTFDGVNATDVTLKNSFISANLGNGINILDSNGAAAPASIFRDFAIDNTRVGAVFVDITGDSIPDMVAGNGLDGFHARDTNFIGVLFEDSFFNGNGAAGGAFNGDGIEFLRSTINPGLVAAHPGMEITTGFKLLNSQVIGNDGDGLRFDAVTATDVTIKNSFISANLGRGILIFDSNGATAPASVFTDFAIDTTRVGAGNVDRDDDGIVGAVAVAGNGFDGFSAVDTTFTGVLFENSFFNANGNGAIFGNGILFQLSTIAPGMVAAHPGAEIVTGFKLLNSQVIGNGNGTIFGGNGVAFIIVDAEDVTIKGSFISANALNGILIDNSVFTDLAIDTTRVGAAFVDRDGDGIVGAAVVAGNGLDGFIAQNTSFTGVLFDNSFFNNNGGNGIRFIESTIVPGSVAAHPGTEITTGFKLLNSQAIGNNDNGLQFDAVTATDVTIKGSFISANLANGINILDSNLADLFLSRFTDLAIDTTRVGQAFVDRDGDGVAGAVAVAGNSLDGVRIADTMVMGAAFLDSFFNANGGDGIEFSNSTIVSGSVTPHEGDTPILTGLTLEAVEVARNGENGVFLGEIIGDDISIHSSNIGGNGFDGIFIDASTISDLAIVDTAIGEFVDAAGMMIGGNIAGNGVFGQNSDFTGVVFEDVWVIGNGTADQAGFRSGIQFNGSNIFSGPVDYLDAANMAQMMTTGLTLERVDATRNRGSGLVLNGTSVNGVTATDISILSSILSENAFDGIFILAIDISDLAIVNTALGAFDDGMGKVVAGNRRDGFLAFQSNFTGVVFEDVWANGNGFASPDPGFQSGIEFRESSIVSGPVTYRDASNMVQTMTTGLTLERVDSSGNADTGLLFVDLPDARDINIHNSIFGGNAVSGVEVSGSTLSDLAIVNTALGAFDDGMGKIVAGNGVNGFLAGVSTMNGGSTLTGVVFKDVWANANGADGIAFVDATILPGVVTFRDAMKMPQTLTTGFALKDSQVVGNTSDGVEFDNVMATDVTIKNTVIAENMENGVAVRNGSDFTDFAIQDSHLGEVRDGMGGTLFAGNGGDGFRGFISTFTGVLFDASFFNDNGNDGIEFSGGMIVSGAVTPHAGDTPIVTGFKLKSSQAVGNPGDGVAFRTVMAADVTIKDTILAENGEFGVLVVDSTFTDFAIQGSHLGEVPDGMGGTLFAGNGLNGFLGEDSTFTGVAFLDSFFNGNGDDGISFLNSTILSGPVTPHAGDTPIMTGFALKNSQVVGNNGNGVEFNTVTATDVTIKDTIVAENALNGVAVQFSTVTDFAIQGSHLGEVRDGMGMVLFAGNGDSGFVGAVSTFTGAAFLDSFFNRNDGDGIAFLSSTINPGDVTPHAGTMLTTGFALKNSHVVGNTSNGVEVTIVTATDVTIKDTVIAENALDGVAIFGSNFIDFAIQNSHIGEARDAMGMVLFAGNGFDGFRDVSSTFAGVLFDGSFFNENGNDGIDFTDSTIMTGAVTPHEGDAPIVTGFKLKNAQVVGNSENGVVFDAVDAEDVTIKDTIIAANTGAGVFIHNNSVFTDFAIQNSHLGEVRDAMGMVLIAGNGLDGFSAFNSTFTGALFDGSFFNGNGDDGIEFFRSTIAPGVVTPHAGTSLTTGFALKDSQVIGNDVDGVDFNEVMATDVTIKNTIVAANTGAGVIVVNSDFTDFAIQNSYLGAAPNPLGGTFAGNGGEGFLGELSTFTGAAFFDSYFNGNGGGENADGIEFEFSTIASGVVTLHDPNMTLTTGFALKNSQVVANLGHGVEFDGTTANDVTIKNTIVAANFGNGVLVGNDSIFTDFAIQDSHLGAAPDGMGGVFAGNGFGGFSGENSTFTGTAILDSFFNENGDDGIQFFNSTIVSGPVTPHAGTPIMTGFALIGSQVVGNGGNGVDILSMIDDVVFDGGTVIAGNGGGVGINVIATGVPGTDGSVLFGNTTITDHMTGILVYAGGPSVVPLLLTFGSTTIEGGTDGLVISGADVALTGGGGMIPGGSPVGGGMMPGDGLFGGSLGTLSFNGQTGNFITFANGALFDPGMPTVIDASNVHFNGVAATMLSQAQRQDVMNRIIDFNDDPSLGLIFLPPSIVTMIPAPAENPGLIDGLPGEENTPGDTLFRLTGGLEFNPDPGQPNAFCFGYSLGQISLTGGPGPDRVVCADLPPAPVTPNQGLGNFWQGWQAARR